MKPFKKTEILGLIIIFSLLVVISVPNFILSLRRARDQVRRDDLGVLVHAMDVYGNDFGEFPPASNDGRIMDCKSPDETVTIDKKGRLVVNLLPCDWGKDSFVDLTPGSSIVYISVLPRDPDYQKGVRYLYFSDGSRYQIFASMEGGKSEAEYDSKIVARGLMCGSNICNVGRSYGCPVEKTLADCEAEANAK